MSQPTFGAAEQIDSRSGRRRSLWKFFRQWLRDPLRTAAVAPSGPELAATMLAALPPGSRRVIELGAGTGVFTQALLEYGIREDSLLVLELNPELHDHLQQRFPGVRVLQADAGHLTESASRNGYLLHGSADAIVSGLGLLSMNLATQRAILSAAFECLHAHGVFVQFTYGPRAPVPRCLVEELGLNVRRGGFVLRNVPPATVYVYSR